MKTIRRAASALLLVITMIASLFVTSVPASASSAYDGYLQVTPTLEVYTDGSAKSTTMDISATWWTDFKQTYEKRLTYNLSWPSDFTSRFETIMQTGGSWGVAVFETASGKEIEFAGTDDPNATCSFSGSGSSDWFQCISAPGSDYLRASYFTHASYGGNGCTTFSGLCSDNGMNVYTAPTQYINLPEEGGLFAAQNGSLDDYEFYIMNYNIDYPVGYAGEILPTTRHQPGADYVAMGDSYSSGEGNIPFDVLTDVAGVNECHRSLTHSYPYVVSQDINLGLSDIAFVACSGATTNSLLNGGQAEGAQIDALSSSTQAVTLTIGGNDLGFESILSQCAYNSPIGPGWGCSSDTGLADALDDRMDALAGTVTGVYEPNGGEIHSIFEVIEEIASAAPNASIYIAGYPTLFGDSIGDFNENEEAPSGAGCGGIGSSGSVFDFDDTQWFNAKAEELNEVIESAVDDAVIEMIDATYVPSTLFAGHGLCDSNDPYLYDIIIDESFKPTRASMHPDESGQSVGYGLIFQTIMD